MKNYIIFDKSNNQKYLFIGKGLSDNENDKIIDTMIKNRKTEGNLGINEKSLKILNKLFTDLPSKGALDKYIIYRYSLDTLTVMDLKKLLFVLLDIPINNMHLWINNISVETHIKNSIQNRIKYESLDIKPNLNDLPEIFGYKFKNEHGIQYIHPDINRFIEAPFKIDYTNQFHDEHSNIIGNYQIKNNLINLNSIDDLLDKNTNNTNNTNKKASELVKDLKFLFFPQEKSTDEKETNENKENRKFYTELYNELRDNITMFNRVYLEDKSVPIYNILYNNLIVYLNLNIDNEIDIENIFTTFELDSTIPFMKYKNTVKSGVEYRIYDGLNSIVKKDSSIDFTDYRNYLVEYVPNKYEPLIDRKILEKWKNNQYVIRENDFNTNIIEELVIKINLHDIKKDLFCHICIDYKGMCRIKIIDDINLTDKEINTIYKRINGLLEKIKYNGKKRDLIDIKEETNLKYISINTLFSINTEDFIPDRNITLNSIKKILDQYYSRCYVVEYNRENIIINYRTSDIYNNFINLKKYFFLLKTRYPDYNIKKFTELWITEARTRFNISSIDALKILENILVEPKDYNPSKINNDEINVVITKGNETNEFIITIINANSKTEATSIIKFMETIFYNLKMKDVPVIKKESAAKESAAKESAAKESAAKESKPTKQKFIDEDDIDIDYSNSNSNNNSNSNSNSNKANNTSTIKPDLFTDDDLKKIEEKEEDDYIEDIKTKKLPNTIRNYMIDMRKKKDKALFFFKSSNIHEPYSIKCGAVDMRQPIIISNEELDNIKSKVKSKEVLNNLDTILTWGSSDKNKNHYLCPRIWCIKCKYIISSKDYIDKGGQCPLCKRGEVKKKEIGENESVIIRKGKSNNYWGDSSPPNDFIEEIEESENYISSSDAKRKTILADYKKKWKIYLGKSEKNAYPSFLDSKLHPKGMCMPCCFANQKRIYKKNKTGDSKNDIYVPKNIGKCFTQEVHSIITKEIDIKKLKDGYMLDRVGKLQTGDIILVNNSKTSKFLKINIDGVTEIVNTFGKLKLPFRNGMKIKELNTDTKYIIYKLQNKFVLNKFNEKDPDINYILGAEKFPIPNKKYGILDKKLDRLFNKNSLAYLEKGIIKNNNTVILRKGIEQNTKNSLLIAMAASLSDNKLSLYGYLEYLIKYLTPFNYLSLNNGEIFRYFTTANINYSENITIFLKWCGVYKDFIDFMGFDEIIGYNKTRYLENIRLPSKSNKIKFLYDIFESHENYKKYLCDLNIYKEYNLVWDLISIEKDSNNDMSIDKSIKINKGLNLYICDISNNKLNILCPPTNDINNFYKESRNNMVLLKNKNLFENIVEVEKTLINTKDNYIFKKKENKTKIGKLFTLIKDTCIINYNELSYEKLYTIFKIDNLYKIKSIIIDKYFRGIGILTTNNLVINTLPFNANFNKSIIYFNQIEHKEIGEAIIEYSKLYDYIKRKYKSDSKSGTKQGSKLEINNIVHNKHNKYYLLNNRKHLLPVKISDKGKIQDYNLDVIEDINLVDTLVFDNFDDISYQDSGIRDSRVDFNETYKYKQKLYNNLKYILSGFFKQPRLNKLKKEIQGLIDNKIIGITYKRDRLYKLINTILKNMVQIKTIKSRKSNSNNNNNSNNNSKKICEDRNIIINFEGDKYALVLEGCKIIISRVDYNKFINVLSEEILRFNYKRNQILSGNFRIHKNTHKTTITSLNFNESIDVIFENKNIYLNRNYSNRIDMSLNSKLIHENNITTKPPPIFVDIDPTIEGSTIGWDDKDYSKNKKVKAAPCIEPYRVRGEQKTSFKGCNFHPKITDSIIKSKKWKICATELNIKKPHTGQLKTFGFCKKPLNYPSSNRKNTKNTTNTKNTNTTNTTKNTKNTNSYPEAPKTPLEWSGVYRDTYLFKECLEENGSKIKPILSFDEAILKANKLGDKCNGVTKTSKGYSLRQGKILRKSKPNTPLGLGSWIKGNSPQYGNVLKRKTQKKVNTKNTNTTKHTNTTNKIDNSIWLQSFFNDANYGIKETVSQGDCFFDSIRLGLEYVGIDKSIKQLRTYLISHIDSNMFNHNKILYENTVKELKKHKKDPIKFKLSENEIENMESIIEEFDFMKNIDSISDFKLFVLDNRFWANSWAISIIEQSLKIKIIILSESEYRRGNHHNILQCGELVQSGKNDIPRCSICGLDSGVRAGFEDNEETKKIIRSILEKHRIDTIKIKTNLVHINNIDDYRILLDLYKNLPEDKHHFKEKKKTNSKKPKGYIIVTYSGNHYRLVTYKNKKYFKSIKELPDNLLDLIKC